MSDRDYSKLIESEIVKPKWDIAIQALLSGKTRDQAADECGVGVATIYRWLKDDDFISQFQTARKEVYDAAIAHLQGSACKASETIIAVMSNPVAKDSDRLAAARYLLEASKEHMDFAELEAKVEALLRAMGGR